MSYRFEVSPREREELLSEFCEAISVLKNPEEILSFLVDIVTSRELIFLTKRIKIAKLLIEGQEYRKIEDSLNVSHSTIAKIAHWLSEAGEGFRIINERTKRKEKKIFANVEAAKETLVGIKRQLPTMLWFQMSTRQEEKIRKALNKIDRKSEIYKEIDEILRKSRDSAAT